MKAKELKEKRDDELQLELTNLKKELSQLRFKKVMGVLENPLKIRTIKKDIARIKTILHLNELERLKKEMIDMETSDE